MGNFLVPITNPDPTHQRSTLHPNGDDTFAETFIGTYVLASADLGSIGAAINAAIAGAGPLTVTCSRGLAQVIVTLTSVSGNPTIALDLQDTIGHNVEPQVWLDATVKNRGDALTPVSYAALVAGAFVKAARDFP